MKRELVRLRSVSEEDVDDILCWVNDPGVVGHIAAFSGGSFTRQEELAYVRAMVASSTDRVFTVQASSDGRYLGQVGLHQIHRRSRVGRLACISAVVPKWARVTERRRSPICSIWHSERKLCTRYG